MQIASKFILKDKFKLDRSTSMEFSEVKLLTRKLSKIHFDVTFAILETMLDFQRECAEFFLVFRVPLLITFDWVHEF